MSRKPLKNPYSKAVFPFVELRTETPEEKKQRVVEENLSKSMETYGVPRDVAKGYTIKNIK